MLVDYIYVVIVNMIRDSPSSRCQRGAPAVAEEVFSLQLINYATSLQVEHLDLNPCEL